MKNRKNSMQKDKAIPKKAKEAIFEYKKSADPLGSYSGITNSMQNELSKKEAFQAVDMKTEGGKIWCSIDSLPVQDADDL